MQSIILIDVSFLPPTTAYTHHQCASHLQTERSYRVHKRKLIYEVFFVPIIRSAIEICCTTMFFVLQSFTYFSFSIKMRKKGLKCMDENEKLDHMVPFGTPYLFFSRSYIFQAVF